jgi:hypothetical protein
MNFKHVAAFALCVAVAGCSRLSAPEGPDKGHSGQNSIYLTGRILDGDGRPIANAVVRLKDRNLSDTTDADGYYCIADGKSDHALPAPCGDSLEYCKDDQVITRQNIPDWNCRMPDVYLIQRDIYGGLTALPQSFSRITATISGADSAPEVKELWYNELNQSYSGFVYFVYSMEPRDYAVYVSIYGSDGSLIGRSLTVTFPSKTAGDINMPAFDPNNVYAGNDSTTDTIPYTPDTNVYNYTPGLPIIVSDSSLGYVNQSLGTTLEGTSIVFSNSDDPTLDALQEPDLSVGAPLLGNWLSDNPVAGNPNWSTLQEVPKQWEVSSEIAVIYPVWVNDSGGIDIIGNFGVDNGMFVWVNGAYKFGSVATGYAVQWEYANINLGHLHQGMNYIEILLEDQGCMNAFTLEITKSN